MFSAEPRETLGKDIFSPPSQWSFPGTWFWWFWLFFIHDEGTKKTGKCEQLMILWSIKKDAQISCNGMDIKIPRQIEPASNGKWLLNGAAAAWHFGEKGMQENLVLEKSGMLLDPKARLLFAPGKTPSSFSLKGGKFITRIKSGGLEFELVAKQEDLHKAVGPIHGKTSLPLGMSVEATRIERLSLSGTKKRDGRSIPIKGTAYFQKVLVAVPPPQWYWGLYHFPDGSFLTYMVSYAGRAMLAGNLWEKPSLKKPTLPVQQDIMLYHAPTGRVFQSASVAVSPKDEGGGLWSHHVKAKGKGFSIEAHAQAYSHACWEFEKKAMGALPKSAFKYNEYPSVLKLARLRTSDGEEISLSNGWGNMENSWGFLL
jgi:hypothetical protein